MLLRGFIHLVLQSNTVFHRTTLPYPSFFYVEWRDSELNFGGLSIFIIYRFCFSYNRIFMCFFNVHWVVQESLLASRGVVSQMTATMQKLSTASARVPYKSRSSPLQQLQLTAPDSESKADRSTSTRALLGLENDSDKRLVVNKY